MKYSMYNVVWYDGVDSFVIKWILPTNEQQAIKELQQAIKELQHYWNSQGYDVEILKLDKLYGVSFDNIVSMKHYGDVRKDTFTRFE